MSDEFMLNLKNRFYNSKGYTLVEMLLFMGLFSIFLVILSNMYATILETQQRSLATSYVELSGRYILSRLIYDVHHADSIQAPASLGGEGTTLVLRRNGSDSTFAVSDGVLSLANGSSTTSLHSNEVSISDFEITRLGNVNGKHTLGVSFVVNSVIPDTTGIQTRTFSTTISTR